MPALKKDMLDAGQAERFVHWAETALGWSDVELLSNLAGGNANITTLGSGSAGHFVVRRPPDAALSQKAAAGIAREAQALSALAETQRTPHLHAFCEDTEVFGVPFAVVEFVPGTTITEHLPPAYGSAPGTVSELGRELMRAIAAVHRTDIARFPKAAPEAKQFADRQIDRWLAIRNERAVRELPLFAEIGTWLKGNRPDDDVLAIIHGDYHLDNCLSDETAPRINAIIDWELVTVGPALIDLGLSLMFWNRRPDEELGFGFVQAVSNQPDVVSVEMLADIWSELSGYDNGNLSYYMVFAFWRLASIVEDAYIQYRDGTVDTAYARNLEHDVPALLREAASQLEQV